VPAVKLLRFGRREFRFSQAFGLAAALFVFAFADGDALMVGCGATLVLLGAVMAAVYHYRPPDRFPQAAQDFFSFVATPVSLTVSLVVCARLIPQYLYFVAIFWTFATWVFNIAVFRSRFLNAFLLFYMTSSLALGIGLNDNPPFLDGAQIFLAAMTGFVLTFHKRVLTDLESEVDNKAREADQALHFDRITGLRNRDGLLEALARAMAEARSVTVLALDIDQSALLRERLGERGVEALMKEIGQRLLAAGRDRDMLAFSGGDRFLLFTTGHANREQAQRFAERMVAVAAQDATADRPVRVSATAGVACFPEDAQEPAVLLHRAEETVRLAKRDQRGRIRTWDRSANEALRRQVELEEDLRRALPANEFLLHFQPKCDATGRIRSLESLVRWRHPQRGLTPPVEFIPVLERMELMHEVGYWILDEAVRQTGVWRARGHERLSVAVNLSARQLQDPGLPDRVAAILGARGMPGAALELEITESLLVHDVEHTRRVLGGLRELGVRNSVDDFGTGYSSLVRLLELPVDVLKIDKSFVDRIGESGQAEALVRLVIQLARHLEKSTVAEGVETQQQLAFLVEAGCDLFQGYYFSRPLDAAAFEARLSQQGAEVQ
jgi:diguanylate cyclase (GGDEF)-like protein